MLSRVGKVAKVAKVVSGWLHLCCLRAVSQYQLYGSWAESGFWRQ